VEDLENYRISLDELLDMNIVISIVKDVEVDNQDSLTQYITPEIGLLEKDTYALLDSKL